MFQWASHPVVGQLESHLNERIGADFALLNLSFAKVSERENVEVHVIGQSLGHCQGPRDLLLTLTNTSREACRSNERMHFSHRADHSHAF